MFVVFQLGVGGGGLLHRGQMPLARDMLVVMTRE